MIIFGTRGIKTTMKEGRFHCPQCEGNRKYKFKKVTQFFTLYFIPLIPLGKKGEYVECTTCKGTFVPRVVDYDPRAGQNEFQSVYEQAMRHSMVLMMLADGEIDENEMVVVQAIINKFGHNDMSLDQLTAFVTEVQNKPEGVETYLAKVTPSLNEHGKEVIIKCAYAVAAADGVVDPSELKLIQQMANVMEMSPTHLKGILAEMNKPEKTFSDN